MLHEGHPDVAAMRDLEHFSVWLPHLNAESICKRKYFLSNDSFKVAFWYHFRLVSTRRTMER